jgi:integrase
MDIDDRWYKGRGDNRERTADYGKGKRWKARWRDEKGRQRSQSFAKRSEAELFIASLKRDLARGTYIDPKAGKVKFKEHAESWRARQLHAASTQQKVASSLTNHVYPHFGNMPISNISPARIQEWVHSLAQQLAVETTRVIYSHVSSIFNEAVRDKLLERSPCMDIKLPKKQAQNKIPLNYVDVQNIANAVPRNLEALVLVGSQTGLRPGELLGLTRSRINLETRNLIVDRQMLTISGKPPHLVPPKTASSNRTIPLGDESIAALRAHLRNFPVDENDPNALIFVQESGLPWRRNTFNHRWRKACRSTGISDDVVPHDLRHFYASLLIRSGVSVKTVQELLGHATATETLNTYSHLWPDAADQARAAVNSVFGSANSPVRLHIA